MYAASLSNRLPLIVLENRRFWYRPLRPDVPPTYGCVYPVEALGPFLDFSRRLRAPFCGLPYTLSAALARVRSAQSLTTRYAPCNRKVAQRLSKSETRTNPYHQTRALQLAPLTGSTGGPIKARVATLPAKSAAHPHHRTRALCNARSCVFRAERGGTLPHHQTGALCNFRLSADHQKGAFLGQS